jgi:hypothetical protein
MTHQRLLADPAELDARLAKGEQRACRRADRALARTVDAMGLWRVRCRGYGCPYVASPPPLKY